MSKRGARWLVVALWVTTGLIALSAVVCGVVSIWTSDERWGDTGMILMFAGIVTGAAAGFVQIDADFS